MADSKAKQPVASPGPRIQMGVLKSSGSKLYLVSTFSQAYKNLEASTIPSLKSSYLEVLLMASCEIPIKLPAASAPMPSFCHDCGR